MAGALREHQRQMRALALDLPRQITEGLRVGTAAGATLPRSASEVWTVGMGGSGIAGDLLENATRPDRDGRFRSIRAPELPSEPPRGVAIAFVSYSGETWETLGAYRAARTAGVPASSRVVVTSGGSLERLARSDGVPVARVPSGLPPRAALGWLFGALVGVLRPPLTSLPDARVSTIARRLRRCEAAYASIRGSPARLAHALADREPTFMVPDAVPAVGRRWANQVSENAKRVAHWEGWTEAMHNSLAAWSTLGRAAARRLAVVLIELREGPGPARTAFEHLERTLGPRGVRVERLSFPSNDRLEAILNAVAFGDHFSLFLAERIPMDPLEIRGITGLKQAIHRKGRPR